MASTFRVQQLLPPAFALLAAASMWFYVRCISVPRQVEEGSRLERPRGNLSDLYPRWLGARELLLHGRDPYSPEITREIQRGYYGREIDPSRPNDPKDQNGFAYPVYAAFLLAPTLHMNFATVKPLFFWMFAAFTVASVFLWEGSLDIPGWRWRTLTTILLLVGSYPFVEAVSLQQPLLFVALLLAGSCLARQRGWLFVSGLLLAIATIKPQVAFLPVLLMLMWVLADWKARRRWFWGFASMMSILMAASELVLPGWLFQFYDAVRSYRMYMAGTSFLDWLVTSRWSGFAWALIVVSVLWTGWRVRALSPQARYAQRAICLALVAVVCTSPNLALYNQVLLLPGVLFWIEQAKTLRMGTLAARLLGRVFVALLAWPWLACGVLIIAKIAFHAERFVQQEWQLPHFAVLSLPVVLFVLLLVLPSATVSPQRTSPTNEMLA